MPCMQQQGASSQSDSSAILQDTHLEPQAPSTSSYAAVHQTLKPQSSHPLLVALFPQARSLTLAASSANLIRTLSLLRKSARRVIAALRLPLARYSVTNAGGRT